MKARRAISILVGLLLLLIAAGFGFKQLESDASTLDIHPGTWSIIAVDPSTGDVGAVGASCVPVNPTVLAALVPGRGVAAVQAELSLENRDRTFNLLQQGFSAEEIVEQMTEDDSDPKTAFRQYGVISLNGGLVQAAGFTGDGNFSWAGDRQDVDYAVSVQGNTLEGEQVVERAMEAFQARDFESIWLPDRLMRALEAGSAAGGDKRCNTDGYQQTALSAFIAVSRADQPPFAAPLTESIELDRPDIPWLYSAVIEVPGGPNPLIELRRQYDDWRESNLPPCPECELLSIDVAAGEIVQDKVTSPPKPQQPGKETEENVLEPSSISKEATPLDLEVETSGESGSTFPIWIIVPVLLGLIAFGVVAVRVLLHSQRDDR